MPRLYISKSGQDSIGRTRGRRMSGIDPSLYLCEGNCWLTNLGNKTGRQECVKQCQANAGGGPPANYPPPPAPSAMPSWLLPAGIGLVALKVLKII